MAKECPGHLRQGIRIAALKCFDESRRQTIDGSDDLRIELGLFTRLRSGDNAECDQQCESQEGCSNHTACYRRKTLT